MGHELQMILSNFSLVKEAGKNYDSWLEYHIENQSIDGPKKLGKFRLNLGGL